MYVKSTFQVIYEPIVQFAIVSYHEKKTFLDFIEHYNVVLPSCNVFFKNIVVDKQIAELLSGKQKYLSKIGNLLICNQQI